MSRPDRERHDVQAGRLSAAEIAHNYADLHPPLNAHQAAVEAARCLFCHDAPCTEACPTGIDVPGFIRRIASGNTRGAAITILSENIMGATCATVCPVEELCEQVCVRNTAEEQPVRIGRLQRFATDDLMARAIQPFQRAPDSGRRIAVVGAGPAGLSCAHRLALRGHRVTVFEAREKGGGLNEYGIAAYKMPEDRAAREVAFILAVGGIELRCGQQLGRDFHLSSLRQDFDAVFLSLGHNDVNRLGLASEDAGEVHNAVEYIARVRQEDLTALPVGRRVVVIGGGNTAIDIAVQIRKLGAESVTLVYRRGPDDMGATAYEQEVAQTAGVLIRHWAQPCALAADEAGVTSVTFERTRENASGELTATGETFTIQSDQVFKAIGQSFSAPLLKTDELPAVESGRIRVDAERRSSLADVWAGGDCIAGRDLTVVAVQDGKIAAESIDRALAATKE